MFETAKKTADCLRRFKRVTTHLGLYLLVVVYSIGGAAIFAYTDSMQPVNHTLDFHAAYLIGYEMITTIGYGSNPPQTVSAMMFCVVFTFLGIPLWLLALTDLGKYFTLIFLQFYNFCAKQYHLSRPGAATPFMETDVIPVWFIAIILVTYLAVFGILVFADHELPFTHQVYFVIITMTTVGFGDITPDSQTPTRMYFQLLYFTFALVITTLFIDRFSEVLRRIHHYGTVVTNSKEVYFWVGDRKTNLGAFTENLLKHAGVPPSKMDSILENLDGLVEQASDKGGDSDMPPPPVYTASSVATQTNEMTEAAPKPQRRDSSTDAMFIQTFDAALNTTPEVSHMTAQTEAVPEEEPPPANEPEQDEAKEEPPPASEPSKRKYDPSTQIGPLPKRPAFLDD